MRVGLAVAVLTGEEKAVSIWSTKVEIVFGHRHSTSHATRTGSPRQSEGVTHFPDTTPEEVRV